MAKMDIQLKKVITPEARLSFPQLFEPKSFRQQEPKYSGVFLFDKKTTDMKPLERAAMNAAIEKWGSRENFPKKMKWPFRDGSERADTDGYKGCTFITATSKQPVGLVDENLERFMDKSKLYAGCYVRAELIAFAFDFEGSTGVSFSLQNVQKLRDGAPFSGKKKAEDVFTKVEKASDDAENYAGMSSFPSGDSEGDDDEYDLE